MPPAPDEGYQPGDIVVTVIPTGYLIGQAAEPIGPGPRWTYIAIVPDLQDAIRHARMAALRRRRDPGQLRRVHD